MREPESTTECVYFSNRNLITGNAKVWVFKKNCPDCNILMSKPKIKGKVKIRAGEYVCEKCGKKEEKEIYESQLTASCKYKCPKCGFEGEGEIPFKWKKIDKIPTLRFQCDKCKTFMDITKKLKNKRGQDE